MNNLNFSVSLKLNARYKGPDDYVESVKLVKGKRYDIFVMRNYDEDVFPCIDIMVLDDGRYGTISYYDPKYASEHWGNAVRKANDTVFELEGEINNG